MSRPTLGVVVTNYDTWELTRRCVEAVLARGDAIDAVLVADDHSSSPVPSGLDPRVQVAVNPRNLGLVRTLNRALARIGTDLVVVFDSDAQPLRPFAETVVRAFADDPRLALAGFRTVDSRGRPTASFELEPGAASLVLGQRLHAWYVAAGRRRGGRRALSIYACAMALRRQAFLDLGGFDERFDWLDFDHDFSMRVNRSSWRLAVLADAVARHEGGGTPQRTSQRVLRFYKNRWLLLTKFGKIRRRRLARAAVLARLLAERAALRALVRLLPERGEALADKLAGRELALAHCREHYR